MNNNENQALQAERRKITTRIIINIIFLMPYIIIFSLEGLSDDPPDSVIIPLGLMALGWGFFGFRWLMDAFFNLTRMTIFMNFHSGCSVLMVGTMICATFGPLIIPILIVANIMQLMKLKEQ
jgi:hypothetical protein